MMVARRVTWCGRIAGLLSVGLAPKYVPTLPAVASALLNSHKVCQIVSEAERGGSCMEHLYHTVATVTP